MEKILAGFLFVSASVCYSEQWIQAHCDLHEIIITDLDKSVDYYQHMRPDHRLFDKRSYRNMEIYLKADDWPAFAQLITKGRQLIENGPEQSDDSDSDSGLTLEYSLDDDSISVAYSSVASAPGPVKEFCHQLLTNVQQLQQRYFPSE